MFVPWLAIVQRICFFINAFILNINVNIYGGVPNKYQEQTLFDFKIHAKKLQKCMLNLQIRAFSAFLHVCLFCISDFFCMNFEIEKKMQTKKLEGHYQKHKRFFK